MENNITKKIVISGVGCCLMDRIYAHADFSSPSFKRYFSLRQGDGGLSIGGLTFEEDLEIFAGQSFGNILPVLSGGKDPDNENIGGPAIVALIHVAQLASDCCSVRFYGCRADDLVGEHLERLLRNTPVDLTHYSIQSDSETPSTTVLSDPDADNGHGERLFVNTIGAAWDYIPSIVDPSFYESDICVFGGTALVPRIHEGLENMLFTARRNGCITVANTVYDFLSEKKNPGLRWPLGSSDATYSLVDLLIADREEALKLSGKDSIDEALDFFRQKGVGAVIITSGADDVHLCACSDRFLHVEPETMPVSKALGKAWKDPSRRGDSTGCGDNFAGGIIASIAEQLASGRNTLDLKAACQLGIVSGGFAGLYYGGTWLESEPGEKRRLLEPYYEEYLKQISIA